VVSEPIGAKRANEPWYRRDGDRLIATGVGVGPGGGQHGAAVAAVVARAVDATPSPVPMDIVRLTIDLSRAVPMGVTEVITTVRRAGKRLQVVEAIVSIDGVAVSRSEALRIRRGDVIDPSEIPPDTAPIYDPSANTVTSPWGKSAFMDSIEIAFEAYTPGRGILWLRLSDQLVEGEIMTPATRAAIAADLSFTGGGMYKNNPSLNADLNLNMHRLPTGERFRIESTVLANPGGWGTSIGTLSDESGPFGYVTKSVLYADRP
jgi:Thioesterase-like superfamily